MRRIVVYEHDLLSVTAEDLSEAELEALARFNDHYGGKYFQLLHQAIRFKNYVGVLQVGDLQIEILPKLDRGEANAPLREVLLQLLAHTQVLKIELSGAAALALQKTTILPLYIRVFLEAVEDLMQKGLLRTYEQKIQASKHWKGQVQLSRQLRLDAIQKPYVISKQSTYSYENQWHQILYSALRILMKMPLEHELIQWAERLLMDFPLQKAKLFQKEDFAQLPYDEKRLPYKNAIQLAELIILGFQPQLKTGGYTIFGLLFDMNFLYEEYVYRQIQGALREGESLKRQVSSRFWAEKEVRPDLLLEIGGAQIVMDCKWKLLVHPSPEDQDLRQIYVYQQHFATKEGWLLYPGRAKQDSFAESFRSSRQQNAHAKARILWLDLLDDQGQLNLKIGEELLELARAILVN
jgi:5-methylcytosine-specific restriction enzyme subunit McrC